MRVALAQINTTVGDLAGNAAKIRDWTGRAADRGAELVVFPELAVTGYPPRDLVEMDEFTALSRETVEILAVELAGGPAVAVGFVEPLDSGSGLGRANSVAFLSGGKIQTTGRKTLLPNYDVFDERRYFDPATRPETVEHGGVLLGLSVCEDMWNDPEFWPDRRYSADPMQQLRDLGARWILNVSASPYHLGKPALRREMVANTCRRLKVGVVFCNQVGGNDSLVFDGNSMVVGPDGSVLASLESFEEDLAVVDIDAPEQEGSHSRPREVLSDEEELLRALTLGVRDYMEKTGFQQAVVGLSGGVDSALTAVIAARALGPDRVLGVAMPSRFTSSMSDEDAAALARNLGIEFDVVPIESLVDGFRHSLSALLQTRGTTDENLQARVRGVILMAISNSRGHLVLSTGNKSELSVGYCTLYGDMAGGLAVIGDVPKTLVYRISEHINREHEVIPRRILERPATAELRDNQADQDSLPPYPELDRILESMVEQRRTAQQLAKAGEDPELVGRVQQLLLRAEYKRRQAAPTLKVTAHAFGEGWRFPVAHRWAGGD